VDGDAPDPQLHSHVVITSAVRDGGQTVAVGQTIGDIAVQRSFKLNWEGLTQLISPVLLVRRVGELAASVDREKLDGRTLEALDQAVRRAEDELSEDGDRPRLSGS
jgi:hypothetical protein